MTKELNQTILLLASEGAIRKVIQEALESRGYFVVTANDLGAAQESLKDCSPDLFMVRPYTEGVPGHEAATCLRSLRPGVPVLIVGGIIDDPGLEDRESLHGFDIFPPPYQAVELLDKVKEILSRKFLTAI